jgi:hypothetical protein
MASPDDRKLFVHVKRPAWGAGILSMELDDRREYLFEDGQRRTIRDGYYHLLETLVQPADVFDRIWQQLNSRLDNGASTSVRSKSASALTVEEQIKIFRALFPDGFLTGAYPKTHRGHGADRRVKRHLDAAIAQARRLLAAPHLATRIENADWAGIMEDFIAVLRGTDLCTPAEVKLMAALPEERFQPIAESLLEALQRGETEGREAFTRLVTAVDTPGHKAPTWPMITTVLGLIEPELEVAVKRSTFVAQAARLNWTFESMPDANAYIRVRQMVASLREQLIAADLPPGDLLDVTNFINITQRPKNRSLL